MSSLMVPPVLQSPREDATQLHRAFKGFGSDTATVVNILSHRDATQRAFLQQEYKNMYHEELNSRLSSELSGNTKTAVLLWMHDPAGRDATILRKALTGDVVDLQAATEVICSRTPSQLQTIKQLYYSKFGGRIEQDLEMIITTGDHQKLLLAYINTVRYEGLEIDRTMAERDAKSLFKAGEKKMGTDEKTFIQIFSGASRAHLAAVSAAYRNVYGSLKKAVKSEMSGKFEFGLLTILKCAENPAKYFAKELYKSMKGLGTTDSTLIRIVVTRTEIDMQYIKAEYHKKFRKSLADAIHSETSSHYRTFLLSLVGS